MLTVKNCFVRIQSLLDVKFRPGGIYFVCNLKNMQIRYERVMSLTSATDCLDVKFRPGVVHYCADR